MTWITVLISLVAALSPVSVWLTLRSERRAKSRDDEARKEADAKERESLKSEMQNLLQTMVVERIDSLAQSIGKLEQRQMNTDQNYAYLRGLLAGKGCLPPDSACPDEKEGL